MNIYPITWEVYQQSPAVMVIPELHGRLIVGTTLHLLSLGDTVSLVTKDLAITRSGLVHVIW
jgi:hypothetical protein